MCSAAWKAGSSGARAFRSPGLRGDRLRRQNQYQRSASPRSGRRRRDSCLGRVLQQSLGRAFDPGPHACGYALRHLRNRHEPCGRDRASRGPGLSADRHRHQRSGRPPRKLHVHRGDRRRQRRDFFGFGPRRRCHHQPRHPDLRPVMAPGGGFTRRPYPDLRRTRRSRRKARQFCNDTGRIEDLGHDPRPASRSEPRGARPASRLERDGGLAGRKGGRGRARSGRRVSRPVHRRTGPRRPLCPANGRWAVHPHRRKLQRQPDLDAGGPLRCWAPPRHRAPDAE